LSEIYVWSTWVSLIGDGVSKRVFIAALQYYFILLKLYDVLIILHKLKGVIKVVPERKIINSLTKVFFIIAYSKDKFKRINSWWYNRKIVYISLILYNNL